MGIKNLSDLRDPLIIVLPPLSLSPEAALQGCGQGQLPVSDPNVTVNP